MLFTEEPTSAWLAYLASPFDALFEVVDPLGAYAGLYRDADYEFGLSIQAIPMMMSQIVAGSSDPHIPPTWYAEGVVTVSAAQASIGIQAASLPVIPVEGSPLTKRSLVDVAVLGTSSLAFYEGHPILFVVSAVGLVAVHAVVGSWWKGAREEVEEFGGDSAAKVLDAIRKRLGIERRSQDRTEG